MKKITLLLSTLLFITPVFAQNHTYCAFDHAVQQLVEEDPSIIEKSKAHEAFVKEFTKNNYNKSGATYVIPVVWHVLHQNGSENISDAQINDAMRILNEDWQKGNADMADVVSDFVSIIADCEIEFRLATLDPYGSPTDGINRYETAETNSGDDGSKGDIWPREMYLNIWSSKIVYGNPNVAAYSRRPVSVDAGSKAGIDGVVIRYDYVGSIGTGDYVRARTLTHEIGHYLDLWHPWGKGPQLGTTTNCNDDDDVEDTPNDIGYATCNLTGASCGPLANVQNYMEYSLCQFMFTEGQKTRMHAALNSSLADRNNLWTTQNLQETGVFDAANVKNYLASSLNFSVYPNPLNDNGQIQFDTREKHLVTITVYDNLGRKISQLENTVLNAGKHQYPIKHLKSGIYFVNLSLDNTTFNKKIIVQ